MHLVRKLKRNPNAYCLLQSSVFLFHVVIIIIVLIPEFINTVYYVHPILLTYINLSQP